MSSALEKMRNLEKHIAAGTIIRKDITFLDGKLRARLTLRNNNFNTGRNTH